VLKLGFFIKKNELNLVKEMKGGMNYRATNIWECRIFDGFH